MKNHIKKYKITLLIALIFGISIFLNVLYKRYFIKSIDVSPMESIPSNLAVYIENGYESNNYDKTSQWPSIGKYVYNSDLSYCENGSLMLYNELTNKFNIKYHGSDFCSVYYDAVDTSNNFNQKIISIAEAGGNVNYTNVVLNGNYYYTGPIQDNYVCIGTTDKDTCTATPDTYLYRIIGAQNNEYDLDGNNIPDGKDYLVKVVGTSMSNFTYERNTAWEDSAFYADLNGSIYEALPEETKSLIVNANWNTGTINYSKQGNATYSKKMWEQETEKKIFSKIGMISASDFLYSWNGYPISTKNQWLAEKTYNYEAILNGYEDESFFGYYFNNMSLYKNSANRSLKYRLSFYLKPNVVVIGGTGTKLDPYIIDAKYNGQLSMVNNLTLRESDGYRFSGATTVKNYVCFGTTDLETCTNANTKENYLYRIIGFIPTEYYKNSSNNTIDSYDYLIKIVRNAVYSTETDVTFAYGISNDWNISSIKRRLNNDDFLSVFDSEWTDNIVNAKWYLGGINTSFESLNLNQLYESERSSGQTWVGKVAIPYMSDAMFASKLTEEDTLSSINTNNRGFLFNMGFSLTHGTVNNVLTYGPSSISDYDATSLNRVKPTFFLSPNVKIVSGTGATSDPYILSIN